jgi:hypothetical protein
LIHNLLPYLPKLRTLKIDAIDFNEETITPSKPILSLNLRVIKVWIIENVEKKNRKNQSSPTTIKCFWINNKNILKKKF